MNRIKKSENGHIWRLNGIWYNFCVKCGDIDDKKPCYDLLDYRGAKHKHNLIYTTFGPTGYCKKCGKEFLLFNNIRNHRSNAATIAEKRVIVPYREEREDRIITRYFTRYFDNYGLWIIYCPLSDDDVLIRDIIT